MDIRQLQFRNIIGRDVVHFDIIVVTSKENYYPEGSIVLNVKTGGYTIIHDDIELMKEAFLDEAFKFAKNILNVL